ncbi:MAG: peptidoglycan-binding protein [Acidobacteriia bacterium]|nr:peptidoglycan-binding protein [Terriglobia bacterium]
MFFASKTRWAGSAFILLTTGMLVQGFPQSAASDSSKGEIATLHQSDIKILQETLRDKGHYRGQVDGVLGLRTRASIRAYQKAENLPVTGGLDTQTAGKLGVRPEVREKTGAGATKGKPSAGISYAKGSGRTGKTPRTAVKIVASPEGGWADREEILQAGNDKQ